MRNLSTRGGNYLLSCRCTSRRGFAKGSSTDGSCAECGTFGGLSLFGAITKADLSSIGRFALFAIIGIVIASFANMIFHSTGLDWLLSIVGVVVFGALTAYDTQKLKEMFASGAVHANLPLVGALTLYLDFVNMFLFMLRIFGGRRDD